MGNVRHFRRIRKHDAFFFFENVVFLWIFSEFVYLFVEISEHVRFSWTFYEFVRFFPHENCEFFVEI